MSKIELMKALHKAFAVRNMDEVYRLIAELDRAIAEQGDDGLTEAEMTFYYDLKGMLGL